MTNTGQTSYEAPRIRSTEIAVDAGFAVSSFTDNNTIDSPWFDNSDENMWNF